MHFVSACVQNRFSPIVRRRAATLLISATLLSAASAAWAQFGYVNQLFRPGFQLIVNPLDLGSNTLNEIMPDVAHGTRVYKFNNSFQYFEPAATFVAGFGWVTNRTLALGEGAWLQSPVEQLVTFIGFTHFDRSRPSVPSGACYLFGSRTPLSAPFSTLFFQAPQEQDVVFLWDPMEQQFEPAFTYSGSGIWDPSEPVISIGEALWLCSGAYPALVPATLPPLFINEWLASNATGLQDEDGDFSDWIEIYNSGAVNVNLQGFALTDTLDIPFKWSFPFTVIPPGGYLLVWASGKNRAFPLHTSFTLNNAGEAIALFSPDGALVDYVRFGSQTPDVSQGPNPRGSTNIISMHVPTPRAPNMIDSAPVITTHPVSRRVNVGSNITFTVAVSGTPPFMYQWRRNGVAIPSATSNTFTIFGVQSSDAANYDVLVSNSIASTNSLSAQLTVNTRPVLPLLGNQFTHAGSTFSLTIQATDADTPPDKLIYSLDSGAPAGAAINPTNGLLTLPTTFAEEGNTYTITVRVSDDGLPPLTAALTFQLGVVSPLRILSIVHDAGAGGNIVTWTCIPGNEYCLQYNIRRFDYDSEWSDVFGGVTATALTASKIDYSIYGDTPRFYRVLCKRVPPTVPQDPYCILTPNILRGKSISSRVLAPMPGEMMADHIEPIPLVMEGADVDLLHQLCQCIPVQARPSERWIDIMDSVKYSWTILEGGGSLSDTDRPAALYTPPMLNIGDTKVIKLQGTVRDTRENDRPVTNTVTITLRREDECKYRKTIEVSPPIGPEIPTVDNAQRPPCVTLPHIWDVVPDLVASPSSINIKVCVGQRVVLRASGFDSDHLTLLCDSQDCGKPTHPERMMIDEMKYTWSTTFGTFPDYPSPPISNSGRTSVIYRAPDEPGMGTITLKIEDSGMQASDGQLNLTIFVTAVKLDLDVDTDRDGIVENEDDECAEDAWNKNGRGAIFNVNFDRDGERVDIAGSPLPDAIDFDDDGTPIHEDRRIENVADQEDITPLMIRKFGVLPTGAQVFLKVVEQEDIDSIHVYPNIRAGESSIWGGLPRGSEPLEKDITALISATEDITFGIEGLFFRNVGAINPFDGEIDLILEVRIDGTAACTDQVRLKVAPWMMLSHAEPSLEVWAVDAGPRNVDLRAKLDTDGQLHTASFLEGGTQWFQDHLEIGYTHRPGQPAKSHSVFRLPYGGQPIWPITKLLKPNVATFQLGGSLGPDSGSVGGSGSFGGNLEILPPTATHKLGRIVMGSTRSDELWNFLISQEVQSPFEVNTKWLGVGHVDEVFMFTDVPNEVAVADPSDAFDLLNAIPAGDRGKSVFFATGAMPESGVASAEATTGQRLETGVNHIGRTWEFLRIYDSMASGSSAAGQIAHIKTLGDGFIEVDLVWDVGTAITPETLSVRTEPADAWVNGPKAGDRYVLVEGTRIWHSGTPAIITATEVLADANLQAVNKTDIQPIIEGIKARLNLAAGGSLAFVKVPTIYVGTRGPGFATDRSAVAFTPGLANLQVVKDKLYFPKQFGPRDTVGMDIFEKTTITRLPKAVFADDWDLYHRLDGEVHCASVTKRRFIMIDWWKNQP